MDKMVQLLQNTSYKTEIFETGSRWSLKPDSPTTPSRGQAVKYFGWSSVILSSKSIQDWKILGNSADIETCMLIW